MPLTGCPHLHPPVGIYDVRSGRGVPKDWRHLTEDPEFGAGNWAGNIYQCRRCRRCWYLFWDPKDMLFSDGFDLPDAFLHICRRSVAVAELEAAMAYSYVEAGKRIAGALAWQVDYCLGQAEYVAQPAFDLMMRLLADARSESSVKRILRWQRSFIAGHMVQDAYSSHQRSRPVVYLDDMIPWLDALGVAPEAAQDVISAAIHWRDDRAADRIAVAPEDRSSLLYAAGLAGDAAPRRGQGTGAQQTPVGDGVQAPTQRRRKFTERAGPDFYRQKPFNGARFSSTFVEDDPQS